MRAITPEGNLWNALGEVGCGAVPTVVVGLTPLKEAAEDIDEFLRVLDGVS